MTNLTDHARRCIENCQKCHATCLHHLATHCIEVGGEHARPEHLRIMMDCVQMCAVCADFMLRDSEHSQSVCAACAQICRDCAASCQAVGDMDECVEACRACADFCGATS